MQGSVIERINRFVDEGSDIESSRQIDLWSQKVHAFLRSALGTEAAFGFLELQQEDEWAQLATQLGYLQGVVALAEDRNQSSQPSLGTERLAAERVTPPDARKVFVVHGHDEAAKESTARFLEKLDLHPVVLHEQASGGRTIIEKFEKYSGDVGFAVVLLTPDDIGGIKSKSDEVRPRARQNVVLELGYFMGKLSRDRVCALYKSGVELPSDIQGVIYVEMDASGAWKTKLAQEFVQAKLPINIEGLLGA